MTRSRPRRPSPAAVRWALDLIPPKREETKAVSSDATELPRDPFTIRPFDDVLAERNQLAATNRDLAELCQSYAAELAALRERADALAGLLRQTSDALEQSNQGGYYDGYHGALLPKVRAALAATPGSGARPAEGEHHAD